MKGHEYILAKQIAWARNRGLNLIGSAITRGRQVYTKDVDVNIFQGLSKEVEEEINQGDGGELKPKNGFPCKMQALHSSSALGVNIFQYWKLNGLAPEIAAACGLCRPGSTVSNEIKFEQKFGILKGGGNAPNIDVVIYNGDKEKYKAFGIECKFSEAYGGRNHDGMKEKYFENEEIWEGLVKLKEEAKNICPQDNKNHYLHEAQLIKHILGLTKKYGKNGFRLLYLWYDVPGEEGAVHRKEVECFSQIVKDEAKFHSMTYQELIARLDASHREKHSDYVKYVTERYF